MNLHDIERRIKWLAAVSILLLTAGCSQPLTPTRATADGEADVSCYWSAEAYADQADVRGALSDGLLSERECSEVVMPYIDASLEQARREARQNAVRAATEAAKEPNHD